MEHDILSRSLNFTTELLLHKLVHFLQSLHSSDIFMPFHWNRFCPHVPLAGTCLLFPCPISTTCSKLNFQFWNNCYSHQIQVTAFISFDSICFTTAFNTSVLETSQQQFLHLHLFTRFGLSWWLLGTVSQFYLTSNLLCSITLSSNRWNKFVLLLSLPLDTNFHTLRNAWFSPTMHLLLYP